MAPAIVSMGVYALLSLAGSKRSPANGRMSKLSTSTSVANTASLTRSTTAVVGSTTTASATATAAAAALNAATMNCFLKLPNNPLSATGLATPFELQPPCSMNVATQQAFAEAAIFDPNTNSMSVYHPLVINAGSKPAAAPVVPTIPNGAIVALWFGFNGLVLQLQDQNGQGTNQSPTLKGISCVNGLPGTNGDTFGQVSWCNTVPFFTAANSAISAGNMAIPDLGTDKNGNACPTSRSFEIVDACPSDNVPTQYLLLSDGTTVQDTAANRAKFPTATVISNASDEALLANIIDPAIGCTPFLNPSLDNPGQMVPSLAGDELQASVKQLAPVARVPLNDPDCLLTANGNISPAKTNAYRLGVNQQPLGTGATTDNGALNTYCNGLVSVAPPFLKGFQTTFTGMTSPAAGVGNNLFTFMCERYLMSLTQLKCPPVANQPIVCATNGAGAATSCTINLTGATATAKTAATGKSMSSALNASTTAAITSVTSATAITSATATTTATRRKGGKVARH